MTARRTSFVVGMICAMLVAAVVASDASASSATAVTSPGGAFTGVTNITGESEGNSIFKATTGGVAIELTATAVEITPISLFQPPFLENTEFGGVMEAQAEGSLKFLHVSANHSCKVNGGSTGTITTQALEAVTRSTTELRFEPVFIPEIASFELSGCAISPLNKKWEISGSVVGTVNGTKIEFTHAGTTAQSTLKFNSSINAGFAGILKIRGQNGNPIAFE